MARINPTTRALGVFSSLIFPALIAATPSTAYTDWQRVLDASVDGRYLSGAYSGAPFKNRIAFVDIDDDGDQDFFVGDPVDTLSYFQNVGTPDCAIWNSPMLIYNDFNPDRHYSSTSHAFADIDGDDDFDLFIGLENGSILFFENTGRRRQPSWAPVVEDYGDIDVVGNAVPAFGDIDGDGDHDLFVGDGDGLVTCYMNTGSVAAAAWAEPIDDYLQSALVTNVFSEAVPVLADIDTDGDLDFFLASYGGTITFYRNTGTVSAASWAPLEIEYAGVHAVLRLDPALVDIDDDGDLDMLVIDEEGWLYLVKNTGTPQTAAWAEKQLYLHTIGDFGTTAVALEDIDGDADLDLFLADTADGMGFRFYENTGTRTSPLWDAPDTNYLGLAFDTTDTNRIRAPVFADLDGDGDSDLLTGKYGGDFTYFKNTGTVTSAQWSPEQASYMGLHTGGNLAFPALADLDADGDLDMVAGVQFGTLVYFQNTGSIFAAAWAAPIVDYSGVDVGWNAKPALADLDRDGDFDLYVGEDQGTIFLYENTGTASSAQWTLVTTNFASINVGFRANPYFCDIDADGDVDLFSGEDIGGLNLWKNGRDGTLKVVPPNLTVPIWRHHPFKVTGNPGGITWTLLQNQSGATIDPVSGYYTAGSVAGLDIVQGADAFGNTGRSYVRVITTGQLQAPGQAILIAGGKSADDPVWKATDHAADFAYNALIERGFAKEDILYLSFDPDQDADGNNEKDDIDGPASRAAVENAFTNFAATASNLFVFIVNHGGAAGGQAAVRLNAAESLTSTQLASWLNNVQDTGDGDVSLVLECCEAGLFLPSMAYSGSARRVVMASTSSNEPTYFMGDSAAGFSDALFSALVNKLNLEQAFHFARTAMAAYQHAVMDDDKDGLYDPDADGAVASLHPVGTDPLIGVDLPQVGRITSNLTLTAGTTALLWAGDVSSTYPLERVWCSITPPSHQPAPDNPVADIPDVDLTYATNTSRYEATCDGFLEPGLYRVVFFARDIAGRVSLPKIAYVSQDGFDERAVLLAADAGGGDAPSLSNRLAFAFQVATRRRLDAEALHVLAPAGLDLDGDGTNDVDAAPTIANLAGAITNWAQAAQRVTVVVIATSGTNGSVTVGPGQVLSAASLDGWLDAFQASNRQVNAVLDFGDAGNFVTNMLPPPSRNRIVVAAAGANETGARFAQRDAGFGIIFWAHIDEGFSIGEAFDRSQETTLSLSHHYQHAELDDDGDGIPGEAGQDGQLAGASHIGAAFVTGADAPFIGRVNPDALLALGETQRVVWAADIVDLEGVSNVWCTVTRPDLAETGVVPSLDLAWNETLQRYEAVCGGLATTGDYWITFFAVDADGAVGLPRQAKLTVPSDVNFNGLPDAWEIANWGSLVGDGPEDDSDGDGVNNQDELLAGTDPSDAASAFELQSSRWDAGARQVRMTWHAEPGSLYRVSSATNLATGPWISTGYAVSNAGLDALQWASPSGTTQGYFRVEQVLP